MVVTRILLLAPRVALVLVAFALAACEQEPPDSSVPAAGTTPIVESYPTPRSTDTLKIASIFPTLGRYAISGVESHRGVRIAVDAIRAEGPVWGREVEVLEYRTGSEPIDAEAAALHAVRNGALAIVGCNASTLSEAIREVAQNREIPMVSNVSTVSDLTRGYDFVFRVCHSDENMARFLADFAYHDLETKRTAVLFEESRSYSKNLADGFIRRILELDPGHPYQRYYYAAYETDFRAQLRAIREFDPDVLFVPGSFIDASLIAVQAARGGGTEGKFEATLLGGDSWNNRLLFDRGGPAVPSYHGDHWFEEGPFRDEYVNRYDDEPNGGRAVLAYDAFGVIVTALRNLGPVTDGQIDPESPNRIQETRGRLRRQLARVTHFGLTGPISFDENGDPPQKGVIVKIERDERILVKRLGVGSEDG